MIFDKKSRIVFVGDSITDCQRDYEAPLAGWGSFGEGYVSLINAFTTAFYPEREYMIINQGVSGHTILDLKKRWQEDILSIQPDVVTIMIGINDVWRHFDGVFSQVHLITKEEFEENYRKLIEETLGTTKKIILMSPFMFEANENDAMRKLLSQYQHIIKEIAADYGIPYVDVQFMVDCFLTKQSSYALSSDRVHPSTFSGHLLIAKAWLDESGFSWSNAKVKERSL